MSGWVWRRGRVRHCIPAVLAAVILPTAPETGRAQEVCVEEVAGECVRFAPAPPQQTGPSRQIPPQATPQPARPVVPHIPLPRDERRAVQAMLNALGYAAGPTDGAFGRRTMEAIRAFERDQGLRADGVLDRATYDRLSARHAARPDQTAPPGPVATPPAAEGTDPPDTTPPPAQAGLQPGTYRAKGRATGVGDWTGVAELTGRRLSLRIVFEGPGGEARLSCETTLDQDDSFACFMRTLPSNWDRRWARGTFPQVRVLPLGSFGGADFDFLPAN